jgi:hypothetical protein
MKKLIIMILCILPLYCYDNNDSTGIIITVNYTGEYFLFFKNTIDNTVAWYLVIKEKDYVFTETELTEKLHSQLKNLQIVIHKIISEKYLDEGNLTLTIYKNNNIIHQTKLPFGTTKKDIEYVF